MLNWRFVYAIHSIHNMNQYKLLSVWTFWFTYFRGTLMRMTQPLKTSELCYFTNIFLYLLTVYYNYFWFGESMNWCFDTFWFGRTSRNLKKSITVHMICRQIYQKSFIVWDGGVRLADISELINARIGSFVSC